MAEEARIAVFVDFENLAIGARDMKGSTFKIEMVLKRLLEKGRVVYKRAYCDWSGYRSAVREFHAHGVEMVDIPRSQMSGKNSADIRMVVDALDLCYAKQHIDVFALISGDSDFSPLVSKLKENDKRVIGCGVKNSTSDLLVASCDEFIYYDDLIRVAQKRPARKPKPKSAESAKKQEAIEQLMEIVRSLDLDYDPLWGSMVKQTIRRVYPGFNEDYYGYRSFADLLKDAEKTGAVDLEYDESRGNYKVRPRAAAGVVRPQRSQARQLHVRSSGPRPGGRHLRLGHDDPRRPADRSRHAAQLLARPVEWGRFTRQSSGNGAHGPAEPGRRRADLRGAHGPRPVSSGLVRGVRVVEDSDGRGAAPSSLARRGQQGPSDGNHRGSSSRVRRARHAAARRTRLTRVFRDR